MGIIPIVILVLIAALILVSYLLSRQGKDITEDAVTFRDRFHRVRQMDQDGK